MNRINIEEIMAEIRREIDVKGYRYEDISFSDIPARVSSGYINHSAALTKHILDLRVHKDIKAYRKLSSNRILGSLIILIKKIIRKFTKFYIEPIVSDQNHFNNRSAVCLQDIYLEMEILKRKVKNLEACNEELFKKLQDAEPGEKNSRESSSNS